MAQYYAFSPSYKSRTQTSPQNYGSSCKLSRLNFIWTRKEVPYGHITTLFPPPQDGHCSHKLKKGNYNRLAHSEVTFRQKENKAFPSHSHHFSFNIIANLGIQHCNPALKRTQSKQSNRNLKSELHLWIQICAHSLLEPPSFPWGKSSHNL